VNNVLRWGFIETAWPGFGLLASPPTHATLRNEPFRVPRQQQRHDGPSQKNLRLRDSGKSKVLGPKRRPPTNFDGKINGRD